MARVWPWIDAGLRHYDVVVVVGLVAIFAAGAVAVVFVGGALISGSDTSRTYD